MTTSEIIKYNCPSFYYALLDFKDRHADDIWTKARINTRQSLNTMSTDEIKAISELMVQHSLSGIGL